MAFDIDRTLHAVTSFLKVDGKFRTVTIGEPKSITPLTSICVAVFMQSTAITKFYLNGGTEEVHVVMVRLYRDMLAEPTEDIETDLAKSVQRIVSDLLGDYDLGATIRNIDGAGGIGTNLGSAWGYTDLSGRMFRIVDITLPLIVDDSATAAA